MNLLRESMTRVETPLFVMRIWRQETIGEEINNRDILKYISSLSNMTLPTAISALLMQFPRVNAVEVVDKNGIGIVDYKDWP